MLHCTMMSHPATAAQQDLEDVLGNLQHARRTGDLGRLALLMYWDVRKWARWTHRDALAGRATDLISLQPHPDRASFLTMVDEVIEELERVQAHWAASSSAID
jgi:hypothetical protein